jgi:hypothetical protein
VDPAERLERILGRDDWESLTPPQVIARKHELEQQLAFVETLANTMRKRRAPNVGAVLSLNGEAE